MTNLDIKQETKVKLELPDMARRLKNTVFPEIDVVVGIATGGVAFAAMVAFWLEKPLHIIYLNYRDDHNKPRHEKPKLLKSFDANFTATKPLATAANGSAKRILLVDDVSVTGATLETAKALLPACHLTSLVIKGKADIVLYPEVRSCILLPWRDM
jgi:uncharacterized protein